MFRMTPPKWDEYSRAWQEFAAARMEAVALQALADAAWADAEVLADAARIALEDAVEEQVPCHRH